MKLILTAAALFSLTTKAPVPVKPSVSEKSTSVALRQLSFPRGVDWFISYMPNLPLFSLHWPATSYPGIGPIPVVFQGVTYTANMGGASAFLLMPGVTISANTPYTIVIAGVNYYFYFNSGTGQCVITGHD